MEIGGQIRIVHHLGLNHTLSKTREQGHVRSKKKEAALTDCNTPLAPAVEKGKKRFVDDLAGNLAGVCYSGRKHGVLAGALCAVAKVEEDSLGAPFRGSPSA